jgi:hypothetical protein
MKDDTIKARHHPRRQPQGIAAAEIRASHEVLELVRDRLDLSLRVIGLRSTGRSWQEVKEALEPSGGLGRTPGKE